jgi:fumarate reductase subunit D
MSIFKNNKVTGTIAATLVTTLVPLVALAQTSAVGGSINRVDDIFRVVEAFVNRTTPFIIGLAVFIIIWGVFRMISGAGDDTQRAEAQKLVFWGVVGIFIMISIWGLVRILINTFNLDTTRPVIQDIFPR